MYENSGRRSCILIIPQ